MTYPHYKLKLSRDWSLNIKNKIIEDHVKRLRSEGFNVRRIVVEDFDEESDKIFGMLHIRFDTEPLTNPELFSLKHWVVSPLSKDQFKRLIE